MLIQYFDNNGTPYTIPLDIHYKRKYAMISDEVLNLLNDFDDKIESYIKELPKKLSFNNWYTKFVSWYFKQ